MHQVAGAQLAFIAQPGHHHRVGARQVQRVVVGAAQIQKNLVRWFSPHVGVWLGAAIFSAIHFQFFGFVPRFVLGLALGYLYLWSGNILVSMAAHFTQNALQLLILYLTQRGQFGWGFDPDATDALPLTLVIPSVLLTAGLLYVLHRSMSAPTAPTQMLTIGRSHCGEFTPRYKH